MKAINYILLGIVMFNTTACEDHLDINQSPNESPTSTMELSLPVAQAGLAVLINTSLGMVSGYLNQYWTNAPQCNTCLPGLRFDNYTYTGADFQIDWDFAFATILSDLRFVRETAESNSAPNYRAISLILSAYTYQLLVDVWDQVPFEEALLGKEGNLSPEHDKGSEVYDRLTAMLEEAVSILQIGSLAPSADDLIYGGDLESWRRFAHTLALRIYLRQVDARPEVARNGIQHLVDQNAPFLVGAENAFISFNGGTLNENPLFKAFFAPPINGILFTTSETIITRFLTSNDPRVNFYFEPASTGPNTGLHVGGPQGLGALGGGLNIPETDFSSPNRAFIASPTAPVYLITGFESLFLQAEAIERGLMPGDAREAYNLAVTAAFNFAGYASEAVNFLNPGGVYEYPNGSQNERLRAIAIQKWMAMCQVQNLESWAETRRNDYFDFQQSAAGIGASLNGSLFPERIQYPPSEIAANPNAPANKNIGDPVWWKK